jgi:sarcosine oxidase
VTRFLSHYDAIVIGLGALGAATLYQLSQRGARVLGIDQFAPPHDRGSSHGDSRITRLAIGEGDEYVPLVHRSHALWRELEARTGRELMTTTGGLGDAIADRVLGRESAHGLDLRPFARERLATSQHL